MKNNSVLNINRSCYTMATIAEDAAEITMYGEIYKTRPKDWNGEPISGPLILQDEFLQDLNEVINSGVKSLTIRMDSLGGDAGASITIHNRLKELSKSGVEITCIVDGVAMSGGSLIMCAADKVIVNPSSLVMIHKCWSFVFGAYNADDLRSLAKDNDAWDNAQVKIYSEKCGKSETVISHMMSETTYMTGQEAIDNGFADELSDDEGVLIAASADRNFIFVRGNQFHLTRGVKAPDYLPTVSAARAEDINHQEQNNKGGTPMATNLEELRVENPGLATQVENEVRAAMANEAASNSASAVEAERDRIRAIDEIACLYDNETVREAKYGENPCTAQELAFRAAQKAAKQGSAFMANMNADNQASGANNVPAAPGEIEENKSEPKTKEEQEKAAEEAVRKALGKKEE